MADDSVYVYFPDPIGEFFENLIQHEGYLNTAEIIREGLNILIRKAEGRKPGRHKTLKEFGTTATPEQLNKLKELTAKAKSKKSVMCPICHHSIISSVGHCLFCGPGTTTPEAAAETEAVV